MTVGNFTANVGQFNSHPVEGVNRTGGKFTRKIIEYESDCMIRNLYVRLLETKQAKQAT